MDISILLDLISDNQLETYIHWLESNPEATEEDSSDFLMDLLTDRQLNEYVETFESTPYRNYYGACMTPDGECFETTMETCRAIGGRFQGPGTSCGGYQSPIMMRSETTETTGKVNSVVLAITVGVMTGVATTIFGNILSEMWLDRLREDPELHTTPDDLEESV